MESKQYLRAIGLSNQMVYCSSFDGEILFTEVMDNYHDVVWNAAIEAAKANIKFDFSGSINEQTVFDELEKLKK